MVAYGIRFDFEVPEIHERQFGPFGPGFGRPSCGFAAAGQFSSLLSFLVCLT